GVRRKNGAQSAADACLTIHAELHFTPRKYPLLGLHALAKVVQCFEHGAVARFYQLLGMAECEPRNVRHARPHEEHWRRTPRLQRMKLKMTHHDACGTHEDGREP